MRLYVETSVISFWYDRHVRNMAKAKAARRFLLLCRQGVHQGHVSAVTREELDASREPWRTRDLNLVSRLGLSSPSFDEGVYRRLLAGYGRLRRLARLPPGDLRHLALYAASDLEAIVTCNLRDLANPAILKAVGDVNHAEGLLKKLFSGPPEAFLPPGVPPGPGRASSPGAEAHGS